MLNPNLDNLFKIYSKESPDFLKPFLQSKTVSRLQDISLMCGTNYTKFYNPQIVISRLDHSFGVALIIRNFTKDPVQTISGLLHDISHTVFSHVGDFLLGDQLNQESAEKYTEQLILNDLVILNELEKLNIKIDDISDYTKYAIADNDGPQLAADRLEYTLSTPIGMGTRNINEIKEIYDNIIILTNENNEIELGFDDYKYGERLGLLSLENDSTYFSSNESTIAMSFASEILKYMIENKYIKSLDLYTLKESELISLILNSNNEYLVKMWEYYTNLNNYKVQENNTNANNFCVSGKNKRRYIDPLIKTQYGNLRLSQLSNKFADLIEKHKIIQNHWLEINFQSKY